MNDRAPLRKRTALAVLFGIELLLVVVLAVLLRHEARNTLAGLVGACLAVLLLQAVFLAPIGWRPRPGRGRAAVGRSLVAGALFVGVLASGLVGLVLGLVFALGGPSFEEFVGRSYRWIAPTVAIVVVFWGASSAFLLAALRRRADDGESMTARLAYALLAGSLAEGLAAIPIEAIAQGRKTCTCGEAHWLGALLAFVVGVFAFGPALVLFVLRYRGRGKLRKNPAP